MKKLYFSRDVEVAITRAIETQNKRVFRRLHRAIIKMPKRISYSDKTCYLEDLEWHLDSEFRYYQFLNSKEVLSRVLSLL